MSTRIKIGTAIAASVVILLFIWGSNHNSDRSSWVLSSYYTVNGLELLGEKNRIGLYSASGAALGRDGFGNGGHVLLYFWGESNELANNYRIEGLHKESGESQILYESAVIKADNNPAGADAHSGAKFGLSRSGLWKLDVYMDSDYFDSVVVEVR
jgi:hypothetical protein